MMPGISIWACSVPGQSSQCSIVCGTSPHLGQLGSTEASGRYLLFYFLFIVYLVYDFIINIGLEMHVVSRPELC